MKHTSLTLIICLFMLLCGIANAQDVSQSTLNEQQKKAEARKNRLDTLKAQETKVGSDLRSVEERIRQLQDSVRIKEAELLAMKEDVERLRSEHATLQSRSEALGKDLAVLLKGIWPIHMRRIQTRFAGLDSWESADRRFLWLTSVYKAVLGKLREAGQAALERATNLRLQSELAVRSESQLKTINKDKDELLRRRLALRSDLAKVRGEKAGIEEELRSILSTIKDLNYQLQSQKTKKFPNLKKLMPWPVQGKVVTTFAPEADPPRRGIGIATSNETPVRAVFWGKVVHNDILRGFGRVVIIYHGLDYYTLYAFLAQSEVNVGQEVEKDEPIGTTGFYPGAKGSGLYFELRFGQKPINPILWLFPK